MKLLATVSLFLTLGLNAGNAASQIRPACDHPCLEKFADDYRAAYVAHDPARAHISQKVIFTENNVGMKFPDASWLAVTEETGPALTFSDPATGNVGIYTTIKLNQTPGYLAIRLKVSHGEIVEIEHMLATKRFVSSPPTPFGEITKLVHDPEMTQDLTPAERVSRAEMIRQADGYFSTLSQNDGTLRGGVKFGPDCHRLENGQEFAANGCEQAFKLGNYRFNARVRDREYFLVDERRGLVMSRAFIDHQGILQTYKLTDGTEKKSPFLEPHSWSVLEVFKVKNGMLGPIETDFIGVAYRTRTPWTKNTQ